MDDALSLPAMPPTDNERIAATVAAEQHRLRAFVRRQVADVAEVDDIVQETFYELVATERLLRPVEHVAAWLMRVARNRVIDRFRARATERAVIGPAIAPDEAPDGVVEEWLAGVDGGPEAAYERAMLAEAFEAAVEALPADQRAVFLAHEFEGRSFKALAAETGIGINTLLGRKHAAVQQLRRALRDFHDTLDT